MPVTSARPFGAVRFQQTCTFSDGPFPVSPSQHNRTSYPSKQIPDLTSLPGGFCFFKMMVQTVATNPEKDQSKINTSRATSSFPLPPDFS